MGSLVGKVETKNGQPRFESSQLRQVSRLRHGDSASCFHPGHTIDSRNQRGQAISSRPVLWSLRVPLVLLRPRHRTKWIRTHLLPKIRRLHSCSNYERSEHWHHGARCLGGFASLSSNIENHRSHAFGASTSFRVSLCFLEGPSH